MRDFVVASCFAAFRIVEMNEFRIERVANCQTISRQRNGTLTKKLCAQATETNSEKQNTSVHFLLSLSLRGHRTSVVLVALHATVCHQRKTAEMFKVSFL